MKSITNLKHNYMRTVFALLAVWLTATTAWAQDITVTYDIGYEWSGTNRVAHITRADNTTLTITWSAGLLQTLWPANGTHGVDDEYDITITPSYELTATDNIFKTDANTTFTVTAGTGNHYIIKSAVFTNNNNAQVGSSTASGNTYSVNVGVDSGKYIAHLIVTLRPDPAHFSYDGEDTYTIHSATGWDLFCNCLQDNDTYNRFADKTVKLGADIEVSRMAGSSNHDFTGTFDGQSHTLTVSYGTAESPVNAQYVAPFLFTTDNGESQPTFRNLNISGSIYEAYTGSEEHHHVGGLIGHLYGTVTIEHCTSNVNITSTGGAGGFVGLCENTVSFTDCVSSAVIHSAGNNNGGFVSWSRDNGHAINFTGCLLNGKILQINGSGHSNGGFIGWKGKSKTVTITNCVVDPAALAAGETMADGNSATFSREYANHAATITNCYYTLTFGETQGQLMHSITPGNNVIITFDGPATPHNVSGITAYTMGENINPGLKYNDTCYSASGNTVSLILDAEAGHYFSGYTANAGTLETTSINLSTAHCQLTMPNGDVTITGTPADEYSIVYDLDGGALPEGQSNRTTYNNQTPTFTLVNPTKQYYNFLGWTGTGLTEPTETVTIAQGSTGHRSYTANWQALCPEPTGVRVTNVTQTTAKLNWTAGGSESSWDIFVTTDANVVPEYNTTPTVSNTGDKPYNLTDLEASTIYYVYVRANCVNHSLWSDPVVFKTLCNAVSLPYSEDFNSDELSICWTTHVANTNNCGIDIRNGALAFKIGSKNDVVAVLPGMVETINLNAYQISFDACYANFDNTYMTSGKVVIGIMTDPNDLATFIPIKEVGITDGYPTYGKHKVWLNHYTGTSGHYIAIKNSYVKNGYVLVDNIEVTKLPTCLEPTDLAVAIDGYDATVTWESDAIGATYDIAFSTTATENPESYIVGHTTNTTYNFTSTQYGDNYVYVRAHCGENSYSEWAGTHFVIGYCAPYIQNHDGKGIVRVRFGSGDHAVDHYDPDGIPSSKPYYGDYSTLVGDIVANTDDTIYITTNTINDDGGEFHYVIAIWVDLDKDLLFDDDEMLWIDEAVEGNGTLKAPIVIPANTPEGDYRMRIYGADDYLNEFYNNGFINWDAPHDVCYGAENAHACDFTVHVIAATPPCRPPIDLGTTISVDENDSGKLKAVLRWKSNSATPESNWTLYWKKSSDNAYTEESISDTPTYTLTGLDTNTDYEFYVLANCDVNEASTPSKVCHFTTPCYPEDILANQPWTENFDLTEEYTIPPCWDNSEGTITEASYKWCYIAETSGFGACNGTSHDNSNCVRFNSVDPSNRQTNYLKSVPVNLPADTPMKLTFWYKNPSGGDYSVLLSTDGGNTCDTLLVTGLRAFEWTQSYPIYLHRYRGQMVVFVFKGTSNHGMDDSFLYLDDVVVSTADDCTPPVAVTASAASNSAVLNWIGNTESAWTVYYKRTLLDDEYTSVSVTTKPPYTLTDLDENTDYEFYVKANCSSTSASKRSETISFHTLCGAILVTADHPYTENFETTEGVTNHTAVGHVPGCWDIDPSGAEVKVLNKGAEMNFTDNETGSQVLYFYGNKVYNFAALPVFENSLRSLEISFKYAFESGQDPQNTSLTLGFIFPEDKGFNTFDTIAYITPYNQSNFEPQKFYEVTKNLKYEVPDRATRLVFRWEPPQNLQLGCNVDDIEVRLGIDTIGKTIVGYGDDPTAGRWYLIANPWYGSHDIVGDMGVGHLTNNTYDLYRFDQAADKEWQNYKATDEDDNPLHPDFTSLVNGQGYLYANRDNVTLNFYGQSYIGDGKIRLTKVESVPLSGWNLVGNPFTEDATVDRDFYRMNDDGDEIITDPYNPIVHLTEGIFVHADNDGDKVTFTPVSKNAKGRNESSASLVLNLLSENTGNVIDRAIVRMGEGETLPKLQIRDNSTKIYIPQKGEDYAIVTSDGQGEMPVNFRPNENGLYTITVNLENVEMEYLHLIDNMTGADIDLLFMPEYTFTARTTDYESRFKLVFSSNEDGPSTDSGAFAFISNGDIIIMADTYDATLQVIDVMGRVVYQRDATNRVSTGGMIKGVYVLRLIERDSIRTQKIVIE